jgi:hypothetical protein
LSCLRSSFPIARRPSESFESTCKSPGVASLRAQAVHSQWLVAECLQEFARGKWEAGDWQSDESNPKAFVGALLIGDAIKGIEIISKVLTGSK